MQLAYYHLLLFTLFCCSSVTSPAPVKNQPRSFKVPIVRRSDYIPNGPASLQRAYAKYGIIPTHFNTSAFDFIPLPPGTERNAVSKAEQPTENGAVTNTPTQHDVQYLSPVTIGGQEFVMNFDTGSSDTWVFNTRLPEKSKVGHAIFDPAKSTTFTPLEGFTFEIRYGDGSFANGGVGIDTVDIGGATVARQAIGLPTEVSESFSGDSESDGLVGLAFTALNTFRPQQQKTFLDNIAEDLSEPVFTAQLKAAETGVYEFGNIDTSKFVGDLIDVPVDASGGFWSIESTMFVVGESNGTLQTVSQGATAAIADTGTTLMLVNDEIMEAYYAKVPNSQRSTQAGGFIFPCGTTLPDLLVSVGGTHLVRIPGSLAEFAPVGTDLTSGSQLCFGGIQSNEGSPFQVWGDVFFKSVFAVFDLRGPKLRLAGHA